MIKDIKFPYVLSTLSVIMIIAILGSITDTNALTKHITYIGNE